MSGPLAFSARRYFVTRPRLEVAAKLRTSGLGIRGLDQDWTRTRRRTRRGLDGWVRLPCLEAVARQCPSFGARLWHHDACRGEGGCDQRVKTRSGWTMQDKGRAAMAGSMHIPSTGTAEVSRDWRRNRFATACEVQSKAQDGLSVSGHQATAKAS